MYNFQWSDLPSEIRSKFSEDEFAALPDRIKQAMFYEYCVQQEVRDGYEELSRSIKRRINIEKYDSLPQYVRDYLGQNSESILDAQVNAISKIPWNAPPPQNVLTLQEASDTFYKDCLTLSLSLRSSP